MKASDEAFQLFSETFTREGLASIDLGPEAQALCDQAVAEVAPLVKASKTGRVQDAWLVSSAVRRLATLPIITDALQQHYRREPFAFQTLNFERGSQQPPHTDALHFHSDPPGFMCGVWIALEDIDPASGPLLYYPGSHNLPYPEAKLAQESLSEQAFSDSLVEELTARQMRPKTVAPRKAEAIIWAANLVHGGSPILDPTATRRSLVVHFFFKGTSFYTPIDSQLTSGRQRLRFPMDVATGAPVWPCNRAGRARAIRPQAIAHWLWKFARRKPVIY